MTAQNLQIDFDQPLVAGSAIKKDVLSRKSFAEAAAGALQKVTSVNGFVLSVEGEWGSGKTSALAMIEDILLQPSEGLRPVIVHFNPWLVGERDALLRHFLARISKEISLSDHAKEGKRVAREIKSYSKVFDIVKLVPGAEPWASIIKTVIESVGESAGSIAEYKTPDIEQHKQRVEQALKKYPKPIIIFIDDIDRLFPLEVFEMIRIIKAVGDLPNLGYVLAWDPTYVADALKRVNVPQAESYLDKIVQVRIPLPSISLSARGQLINNALTRIDPEALKSRFKDDENRLSSLYFAGLRELLAQPRDVTRVFNTVRVIEPAIRGEVNFADIVGLAALMVKATPIFELLRRSPTYFVGRFPNSSGLGEKSDDLLQVGTDERKAALEACQLPAQVKRVVQFLFPLVAEADDEFAFGQVSDVAGHIAHPARLLVALQMNIGSADVSLGAARTYLHQANERDVIADALTSENCFEFMETLGDVAQFSDGKGINDLDALCLSIAALADRNPFPVRSKARDQLFVLRSEAIALRAIDYVVKAVGPDKGEAIAEKIIKSRHALTVAANLIGRSYLWHKDEQPEPVTAASSCKESMLQTFATNVLETCKTGEIFATSNPGFVFFILARAIPYACRGVFKAIKTAAPNLDNFALELLRHSFDSNKGQTYSLPKDIVLLTAYCSLEKFKEHARLRLVNHDLKFPARAAWMSVIEGKALYGIDGSDSNR
ncbi:KAP family P-loop NTPase fold protein [Rhodoferax fermentans]|uniref:KAP NTPase domain-containing protein n=1 Tax=Rhodoferax fermentans TaxID=28066 RepID=A0A1T1ASJ8_RHOFE|nr:P-loop NTPase fold protein [Rhodoferax fermentans]MBK1684090.1 hypothetical protein [Rhodoferax fermentans]OOV06973.1 hypothetical protein RF819_09765 [Rhodoferax fermentans]